MIFFSLIFISCSPRIYNKSTNEVIVYPSPPDTARIQYLTSISNSEDIKRKQSAFTRSVVGESKVLPIIKPYGVFMRNGKIYICDIAIGGLEILDLEKKEFKYFVPQGQNQLKNPLNCYVDSNDQLYIADIDQQKIVVFDSIGKHIISFGKKENLKPSDVYVHKNKIYVADSGNHRINVYNKDTYEFEYYFPESEKGDDSFLYRPANIAVSDDKVYVSDMGNSVITVLTHKGEYINTIGKLGKNLGDFVRPKGIAVDHEDNTYVVDGSFENVQIFNKDGKLLLFFGGAYKGHGDMWLPTSVNINYDSVKFFEQYVDPKYDLKYLILVANQFGPDKISVYGRIELKKGNEKKAKKN